MHKMTEVDITLDTIVEEVRERRRKLTQRFDNDPGKIIAELLRMARKHPEKMVGQIRVVPVSQEEAGEAENK